MVGSTPIPERATAMISIVHLDLREDLERDARVHGLIPRSLGLMSP